MPTVISHLAVPLAIGIGMGRKTVSLPLLAVGAVVSVLPDLDVLAFRYGIAYSNQFGHRGASHSLLVAALLGVIAASTARLLKCDGRVAFFYTAICAASHGLLDMLTDAGLGIALWWPLSNDRLFAPWRPIEASPLTVERVMSARGLDVFQSELVWVWMPAAVFCVALLALRRVARGRAGER